MKKNQQQFIDRSMRAYILDTQENQSFYNAGDIVHCYMGNVFWCLALTSKEKDSIFQKKLDEKSFVILSSLMTLDKKRFIRIKYKLSTDLLSDKKAISDLSLR